MTKQLLRTIIFSTVLCLTSFVSKAQWVTIPDTAFVSYLQATFPACMNGNLMDTTCSGIVNATMVNCSQRPIKDLTGIQYFDHLETLNCSYDSLTTLPALRIGLNDLYCHNNQLTSLPSLPNSLSSLICADNQLTNITALPSSLTQLVCDNNFIASLPALPNGLTSLFCFGNQLTGLPALPSSLTALSCSFNQVTSLPALPSGLTSLSCHSNQLTSLPALPSSLTSLWCNHNQLTVLPVLSSSLTILWCHHNQLTSLPILPSSLTNLTCDTNQLISLPELPDSLNYFSCSHNPNLTCLPRLKKIKSLGFYNTAITCLPNYPQSNTFSYPPLNSLPLCDILNPNGCASFWNIAGTVYIDTNANCNHDAGENGFTGAKVQLYQSGVLQQQAYNGNGGAFSFDTDLGDYSFSIDTSNLPFDLACPDTGYYTVSVTALDSFITGKDFGLHCKPGFDIGVQSIYGWGFRPASIRQVDIHAGDISNFYNANCAAGISGEVTVTITGSANYVSPAIGALTPSSVSGNLLTYNVADFGAINFNSSFNIIVQTDTTAVLGSQICFTVSVTPTAGDNNLTNNTLSQCFTVVGSYDPNEKEVSPVNKVSAGDWLTYTINFQNTGTDTAQHIYVTDTLSQYVDEGSFQLLAYSHKPIVQLNGKAVRFNFPNINLPDSNTNEALSHGYVQYRVKLKNNLQLGTPISNTAFIYFDFNSPVVTNTTSNTITTTTGIENFEFRNADFGLNPNPASESVRISVDESMVGSNLTITDITGRRLITLSVANSTFSISTAAFSNGVYFVRIGNATVSGTKKLVVKQQ